MADAAGSVAVNVGKFALQARNLAHTANDVEVRRGTLAHLERNARGIIAAILHALEACDQDVLCNIRAGVADDSAHRIDPFVRVTARRPRTGGAETYNVRVLSSRNRKLIYQKWYLNLDTTRCTHAQTTTKGTGTFVAVWTATRSGDLSQSVTGRAGFTVQMLQIKTIESRGSKNHHKRACPLRGGFGRQRCYTR